VKRWGKSPPLQAQARRHGKPHRVQGQIGDCGAARSTFRASGTGSGYWLLRQMVLSVPQGMQTEFGLQPFQNQQTGNSIRPPVRLIPADSFPVRDKGLDDFYKSSKTDIAQGSLRNPRDAVESEPGRRRDCLIRRACRHRRTTWLPAPRKTRRSPTTRRIAHPLQKHGRRLSTLVLRKSRSGNDPVDFRN